MNGILYINKEKDYTSRDVVNKVCKILKTKKVGHTGTLDPMAEGVLIVCVGSATKLVEIITASEKEYVAEVTLGIDTDTIDNTGKVLIEENAIKTEAEIREVLNSMIGTYNQEVPIYSAVKIKGKKLYEYAREGSEVELPKREVEIKELELVGDIQYTDSKTIFKIRTVVSKGTYIRSLIRDIAKGLNTVGIMSSLTRTKQGKVLLSECVKLEDIENNIHPVNEFFKAMEKVLVDDYLENRIRNGSILENRYSSDNVVFTSKDGNILAIYKVYDKDQSKIKPWKMFIKGSD